MPSKQDILTAVRYPQHFLKVKELKGAVPRLNSDDTPYRHVGGFNMVFQLIEGSNKWAFRVWHVSLDHIKERYKEIASYLKQKQLNYFGEFVYDEGGLLVNGELLDTVRMQWLDGYLLKDYIEKHLHQSVVLNELAEKFLAMCNDLDHDQISHGDLQEGNILIDDGGNIKLIDYDSICVPALEGGKDVVTGLKGYQHPSRFTIGKASLKADYFSELVIYLSILAIADNPMLWDKYQVKDTRYLLFTEDDFEDTESSSIYKDLLGRSGQIDYLLSILIEYLEVDDFRNLPPFTSYFEDPEILEFEADNLVTLKGRSVNLRWKTKNAQDIRLNGGQQLGESGSISVAPKEDAEYTLTASSFKGVEEKKILVTVLPTKVIESLKVPMPDFSSSLNLSAFQLTTPRVDLKVETPSFGSNLPKFEQQKISRQRLELSRPNPTLKNITNVFERIRNRFR